MQKNKLGTYPLEEHLTPLVVSIRPLVINGNGNRILVVNKRRKEVVNKNSLCNFGYTDILYMESE